MNTQQQSELKVFFPVSNPGKKILIPFLSIFSFLSFFLSFFFNNYSGLVFQIFNNYSTRACWISNDYNQLGATRLDGYLSFDIQRNHVE